MGWFKRLKDGIQTATKSKKETPDGLWHKCKKCNHLSTIKELEENFFKCIECSHHIRIGSHDYFDMLFDGKYITHHDELTSYDFLDFTDLKPYTTRLEEAGNKTGLNDAITIADGKVGRKPLVIAAMDFTYIGGSMGSVVGEKIARAIDLAIEMNCPLLLISKSGGARMMESAFSLMQMAKTAAKLTQLAKAGLPYFSLMTDPTTGGVSASYAMLGDINFAEPKALIGFAGPRVIKDMIKKDLPENFQIAESVQDHGFLDFIVDRSELKTTLIEILNFFHVKPA
jgi:acetyl-CoA carboxylase carboxyl transferase subunit beta